MRSLQGLLTALLLVVAAGTAVARDPQYITKNSEGREFWVCFMKNFREAAKGSANSDRIRLQLFLTSSYDAQARIRVEGIRYDSTVASPCPPASSCSAPKHRSGWPCTSRPTR
jgi:hypothetical protein